MSRRKWAGAGLLQHPFGPRPKHAYLKQLVRYRRRLQRASAALIHARQTDVQTNVEQLLLSAWDGSPFWEARMRNAGLTRRDLCSPDAILAIPPVNRTDIQENFSTILHRHAPRAVWDDAYLGTTSGSTGQPLRYMSDGFSYLWYWAFVDAVVRMLSLPIRWRRGRVDAVLLCALGHSPEYGDFIPVFHGVRFRKVNVLAENARSRLERLNPQLITGDPDSLRATLGWDLRPKLIMSSAFAMPPAERLALSEATGAAVVEYYSAAETGMIGVNLPGSAGFEVLSPAVKAEILPETGRDSDDHTGEVVITNLRNPWFPLIRYRLGDRAQLRAPHGESPLRVPVLEGLRGRTKERFATAGGKWFDPNLVTPILARSGVHEFALTELSPGKYQLDVHGRPSAQTLPALESRLLSLYGAEIEVVATEHAHTWRKPGVKPKPFRPQGLPGASPVSES